MPASSKPPRFRRATPDDSGDVVELLLALYRKLGAAYGIPADTKSVVQAVIHTIHNGICIVGDCSCAGGFIENYVWNRHAKIGTVLFWNYSRPSGIKVFEALVKEFKRCGATHINVASHFPENLAGRFYTRFGLKQCEVQWITEIATMTPLFPYDQRLSRSQAS